jgi:hypothetical protein
VEKQIQEKTEKLEVSEEWMNLAKAFAGIVSNINVTDQWRRAWHDYGAGAQDSFTQTRWAEYQRVSELIALMEMPGVGRAMQKAFRAMCLIGLNRGGEVSPRALNIMQMKGVTEDQIQNGFILPIREYVKGQIGNGAEDLYVNFGVEMARMLLENSLAAGWLGVERDDSGNIKYKRGKDQSSNVNSEEYKYAEAASAGDGSAYGDRQNDYIKLVATRAKQMAEFAKGYETGLPALVPVLPDWLTEPWIAHKNVVAIANGNRSLLEVFTGTTVEDDEAVADYPENSRWGWAYGMFRGAQIYDLVSKFIVGLKGFRGVAEEVDFFLRSPANLGSLSKKIDVAFGDDLEENQRFRMNVAMSLIYAVYPQKANPLNKDELKTVLHDRSGGKELTIMNFEKDDIARIFVHRSGFLSEKQWDYLWSVRLRHQINPGEGGGFEVGMIKRGENLPEYYLDDKTIKENRRNRREAVARAV